MQSLLRKHSRKPGWGCTWSFPPISSGFFDIAFTLVLATSRLLWPLRWFTRRRQNVLLLIISIAWFALNGRKNWTPIAIWLRSWNCRRWAIPSGIVAKIPLTSTKRVHFLFQNWTALFVTICSFFWCCPHAHIARSVHIEPQTRLPTSIVAFTKKRKPTIICKQYRFCYWCNHQSYN